MAFGRSNSLQINTGSTNSLLIDGCVCASGTAGRDRDTAKDMHQSFLDRRKTLDPSVLTSVSRPAGAAALTILITPPSIDSSSLNQSTKLTMSGSGQQSQTSQPPAPTGGLFGNSTTSQPQQSGGLFGNTTSNTQPTTGSNLFGASTNQSNQQGQSQTGGTGLFGATQNQSNQQPVTGSNLFGASTNNQSTGGLFGASTTNNAASGGLFGSAAGGSLFGGANQNQQKPATNLFGASTQQQRPTSNLFGASTQQQPASNGLFGASNQQQQAASSTFLGMTATAPGANPQYSLLGASQFRNPQVGQFAGRLTLGQPASNAAVAGSSQQGGVGAVQVNLDTMKSTTRFNDLIPEVQAELEKIDAMIRAQEKFCRETEAFLPKHRANVESVRPDIELIAEKTEAVETALALDAQGVQSERNVLQKDIRDGERLQRVVDNLHLPAQYHVRGDDARSQDMDLISNFFRPLTDDMANTLSVYANAIAEVEGHMSILEASAQTTGAKLGRGSGSEGVGSVRELAETLGAFEEGILDAAGLVGGCREGVNALVMGR